MNEKELTKILRDPLVESAANWSDRETRIDTPYDGDKHANMAMWIAVEISRSFDQALPSLRLYPANGGFSRGRCTKWTAPLLLSKGSQTNERG